MKVSISTIVFPERQSNISDVGLVFNPSVTELDVQYKQGLSICYNPAHKVCELTSQHASFIAVLFNSWNPCTPAKGARA